MENKFGRIKTVLPFLLLFLVAAFLLFFQLFTLGLEYDELLAANAALGCPHPSMFLHFYKIIFGRCVPLMLMEYIGAPVAIPLKFFTHFFGPSVYTVRGVNISFLLLTLLGFCLFLKKRFNLKVAFLTICFLVFDSQFIFTNWIDRPTVWPFILRTVLVSLMLADNFKFRYLLIGIFSGGVIYTKIDNLFFVGALLAAKLLYEFFAGKYYKPTVKKIKYLFVAGASFAVGFIVSAFPLIKYLQYHLKSLIAVMGEYRKFLGGENVYTRTDSFLRQLTNSDLYLYVFHREIPISTTTVILAQILIVGWLALSLYLLIATKIKQKWIGLAVIFFYFIYINYPTMQGSHHRLLIYPVPQLVLAFAISDSIKKITKIRQSFFPALFLFMYLLVFLQTYTETIRAVRNTCGYSSFNCAIFPLAEKLKNEEKKIVVADWGIATQLLYSSNGKAKIEEIAFEGLEKKLDEFSKILTPFLKECDVVVLRYPGLAKFQASDKMTRETLSKYPKYESETVYDIHKVPQYQIFRCN